MVSVVAAVYLLISVILPHSCAGFTTGHAKRYKGFYGASDSFLDEENSSGGVVSVNIQRDLPNVTPREARDAWIEFHWKKGGGLPIAILSTKDSPDDKKDTEQSTSINTTTTVEEQSLERTILPIIMKERAEYVNSKSVDEKSLDIQYKVTDAGPFFADLIPGSHVASVNFEATSNDCSEGCTMTWDVTFSTKRWSSFYEAVTQFTVGTAATTTVQEAVSPPRLFSMTTTIEGSSIESEFARRECLDFVFGEGGGLPLPPPIPFGDNVLSDSKSARQNLVRIPPLIVESIVGTTTSDNMVDFTYCLNDPGWKTFPFLLHTHLGKVSFTRSNAISSESDLIINWDVEIRPYKFVSGLMEKLVEMTVTTIMRNLRVRLTEPGARVIVKQPRGKGQMSFGTVSKDTWLGGVLHSHLSDQRSTLDQTISLLQPWTWGRSGRGDENDCVQFQWTDGNI